MFYDSSLANKKILLHACCGPCALGAIAPLLEENAAVTLFYYNPGIIDGEFEKRLEALSAVAAHYSLELIVPPHDYGGFLSFAAPRELDPEGGERCSLCMGERLEFSARYALDNGFDAYTTTLTVSPHKNSKLIFKLAGDLAAAGIGAPFIARDFKKRDGFKRSCELSRELGIYRQGFCGCEFSAASAGLNVAEYSARVKAEYGEGSSW